MSSNPKEQEIPKMLPLLPVRDMVVFPYMILPLYVGRDSSIKAVEKALTNDRYIFLASQVEVDEEEPSHESIYKIGTIASIMRMRKLSDGRVKILVRGVCKAVIDEFVSKKPFFEVKLEPLEEVEPSKPSNEVELLIRNTRDKLEKLIGWGKLLSPDILLVLDDVDQPGRLADLIASNLSLAVNDCQRVLEVTDPAERLRLVDEILSLEIEIHETMFKISKRVRCLVLKENTFCVNK